jgi:hypothetical protein
LYFKCFLFGSVLLTCAAMSSGISTLSSIHGITEACYLKLST